MTSRMTFSNKMTIVRAIASIVMIPLLTVDSQGYRVFALLIFTLAAFTDYYDGRLARINRERTNFGVIADPIADKFLTIVGLTAVSMIEPAIVPLWMTIVIAAREVLITAYRLLAVGAGRFIAADRWGKWKTGLQMTVIPYGLVFGAIYSGDDGRAWEALIRPTPVGRAIDMIGYGLAFFTTALTLFSGLQFCRAELRRRRG